MPYIKKTFREEIDHEIDQLSTSIKNVYNNNPAQTRDGLVNYALTRLLNNIYANAKYHDYNELIGAIECCKLEFYRKTIGPYEEQKEYENGSVKKFD